MRYWIARINSVDKYLFKMSKKDNESFSMELAYRKILVSKNLYSCIFIDITKGL